MHLNPSQHILPWNAYGANPAPASGTHANIATPSSLTAERSHAKTASIPAAQTASAIRLAGLPRNSRRNSSNRCKGNSPDSSCCPTGHERSSRMTSTPSDDHHEIRDFFVLYSRYCHRIEEDWKTREPEFVSTLGNGIACRDGKARGIAFETDAAKVFNTYGIVPFVCLQCHVRDGTGWKWCAPNDSKMRFVVAFHCHVRRPVYVIMTVLTREESREEMTLSRDKFNFSFHGYVAQVAVRTVHHVGPVAVKSPRISHPHKGCEEILRYSCDAMEATQRIQQHRLRSIRPVSQPLQQRCQLIPRRLTNMRLQHSALSFAAPSSCAMHMSSHSVRRLPSGG